eukprot:TRINITY_DN27399_c0_g1_i1.p1 TRINITY_DN27399_c0_g1~~TRINITY_DN27399_c0_g1_i1.p1  ORF type:complete len:442 (-),score=123.22 TRINITY_DN27399_c0_g1_i1:54-1379(-)
MDAVARQFEESKKSWQEETAVLRELADTLALQKQKAEGEVAELTAEVQRLRSSPGSSVSGADRSPSASSVAQDPRFEDLVRATIDSLKSDLAEEKAKSRKLEERAAGLSAQLGSPNAAANLPESTFTISPHGTPTSMNLEKTCERLQEELCRERQKVSDLKRAAQTRAATWKEELAKIQSELSTKEGLEKEVAKLREEQTQLLEKLSQSRHGADHEKDPALPTFGSGLNLHMDAPPPLGEAERLQAKLAQARLDAEHRESQFADELKHLSGTFGRQLQSVEQELRRQVHQNATTQELFLKHLRGPIERVLQACQHLAASGPLTLRTRRAPAALEGKDQDLHSQLVKIVDIMRFAADVLEAYKGLQSSDRAALSTPQQEHAKHKEQVPSRQPEGGAQQLLASVVKSVGPESNRRSPYGLMYSSADRSAERPYDETHLLQPAD